MILYFMSTVNGAKLIAATSRQLPISIFVFIAWYLAEAATALDVSLETVFQENLDKLRRRFPNGFDTQASVHRKKDDI